MMLLAVDIDGTVDADPQVFQTLCAALRAAGIEIAVLTGLHGIKQVQPADVQAKQQYLADLGFSAFDHLAVFPDNGDLPQLKAQWCRDHGAAVLVDNSKANAEAAQDVCLVLVPWATRLGKKKGGKVAKMLTITDRDGHLESP